MCVRARASYIQDQALSLVLGYAATSMVRWPHLSWVVSVHRSPLMTSSYASTTEHTFDTVITSYTICAISMSKQCTPFLYVAFLTHDRVWVHVSFENGKGKEGRRRTTEFGCMSD